jgi:lysozyme
MILFPFDEALTSLKKEEGWSATAYKCASNRITLGWGRNVDKNGGLGISKSEGEVLLRNDVERCLVECKKAFSFFDDLTPNRQRALVEICFQLGMPSLKNFKKALGAVHRQDYELASREFLNSKWAKQTPARAKRMAKLIRYG